MWVAAIVALLLQAVPAASFLVVAPRSSYQAPFAKTKASTIVKEDPAGPSSSTFLTMASLVLASSLVASTLKSKKAQTSLITRHYGDARRWKTYPAYPHFRGLLRDEVTGPESTRSTRLYLSFDKNPRFMLRFHKQNKVLAQAGLTRYTTGWEEWSREKEEWKAYQGPESHPDNPFFPAASHGFTMWGALPSAKPAASLSSSSQPAASFAFAGSSSMLSFGAAKRAAARPSGRSARFGVVMHAHKKAATASKNQGGKQNQRRKGRLVWSLQGNAVKTSQRLVRQNSLKWDNGAHVTRCRTFMLKSKKDGIVQYFGSGRNLEVAVIPWEYVRKKCVWVDGQTLGPKSYEPWMGNKEGAAIPAVRKHIVNLRTEWLKTDEGVAWQEKKVAQQKKRDQYAQKTRERGARWKWLRSEEGQSATAANKAKREVKLSAAGSADSPA